MGERNIATKTIEILEIEKRGLQDHLRSRPDGAHDAARAKDAKSVACVIS